MSEEIVLQRSPSQSTEPTVDSTPKYPSESIDLPSNGYFYPNTSPLSKGVVELKMMTAKEEDILTSQNLIKKGIVLDKLLESLIVTPNIKIGDLLICDKNALFVAARRLAYGDSYGPLQIKCPSCTEESKETIDLSQLKEKPIDFDKFQKEKNIFEFQLPFSKKMVNFRLLTSKDEDEVDSEVKSVSKYLKSGGSAEITTRLKKLIISIDGNDDRSAINKFVDEELLSRDSSALRAHIRNLSPELDMSFNFRCSSCDHEERMDVPMTVQFFWPDAGV